MFWIPLQLLSQIFVILRRTERDMFKNDYWSTWKVSTILVRFKWSFNFLRRFFFFEKYSNTKFHENPSSGSRVVPCGQTVGRRNMTKLLVAFRNFTNPSKNVLNVPSAPKRWQRCLIQLTIALRLTDIKTSVGTFLRLPYPYYTPH